MGLPPLSGSTRGRTAGRQRDLRLVGGSLVVVTIVPRVLDQKPRLLLIEDDGNSGIRDWLMCRVVFPK